jgi:hypothetical protein
MMSIPQKKCQPIWTDILASYIFKIDYFENQISCGKGGETVCVTIFLFSSS